MWEIENNIEEDCEGPTSSGAESLILATDMHGSGYRIIRKKSVLIRDANKH